MDIPEEIKKWLFYDENNFEYVVKKDAPEKIIKAYEKFLDQINDFILI